MVFDAKRTCWSVERGNNEGDVSYSNVGRAYGGEICLLIDEGPDSKEGVGCSEEDEEENTDFECFFFGAELEFYHDVNRK